MRTRRAPRDGADARRPLAVAAAAGLLIIIAAVLAGCSHGGPLSARSAPGEAAPAAVASASAAASAPAAQFNGAASAGSASSSGTGEPADATLVANSQKLIYTAQLTVRAPSVKAAVSRATAVVAAAGGYIGRMSSASDPAHPSHATATVTFKIPVAAYHGTLAALSGTALGAQLSLTQQAQDVTQQVADVNSRVASDQAAIVQLRTLLKHAGTVGDLLSVQDQINAEETGLESTLAQQNALDHETSFATMTLTVIGPAAARPVRRPTKAAPPPGLNRGLADGWHALHLALSWLLTVIGTVAPFAAAAMVVGGLIWGGRRLTRHRPT